MRDILPAGDTGILNSMMPTKVHLQPMKEQLDRRKNAASSQWNLKDEIVVVGAGQPVPIPGRGDQTYPFRAHSEYFYLTDRERAGGVLAFDPEEGWTDFVPWVTQDEAVWVGSVSDEGVSLTKLGPWLEKRKGRRMACLGSPVSGIHSDPALASELRERLSHIRRAKDHVELSRMRKAEEATRAGFETLKPLLKTGTTERAAQIEIEATFFRHGADRTAYDTIVGSGPNSAVFHFTPTQRAFQEGELVLVDAGAEYRGYACDVTRTYPVSGRFKPEQADIYWIVLGAHEAAVKRCAPKTEYKEIHMQASRDIAQGLVDFGLLRGDADSLVEQGAQALFFPHGIGHMVGLGVRDAGGYLPNRKPGETLGLRYLRIDLPLKPGYVVTIEPGIYFIPALLKDAGFRQRYHDAVNWNRVDAMMGFGGIRIEDNVHVTENGPEVLTANIPKHQA
jgi:Xaa-Pro aminopeptidase